MLTVVYDHYCYFIKKDIYTSRDKNNGLMVNIAEVISVISLNEETKPSKKVARKVDLLKTEPHSKFHASALPSLSGTFLLRRVVRLKGWR